MPTLATPNGTRRSNLLLISKRLHRLADDAIRANTTPSAEACDSALRAVFGAMDAGCFSNVGVLSTIRADHDSIGLHYGSQFWPMVRQWLRVEHPHLISTSVVLRSAAHFANICRLLADLVENETATRAAEDVEPELAANPDTAASTTSSIVGQAPDVGISISVNDPSAAKAKGMTWQHATKAAEYHCARNPFPGVNALAVIVGCSPSTMSKAIDRSSKLRVKLVEHKAQRKGVSTVAMTERAAATARQTREPDPVDAASASSDDLFRRLLEQAKPSERAKLNAMTPSQRRELVATVEHDPECCNPDHSPRVRGRSR